jgi:hypothetical protein
MKTRTSIPLVLIISVLVLGACTQPEQTPAIDAQATIDAAVQATQSAGQNAQATVDAAVQATVQAQEAQQAAVDQAVQATLTAVPTPDYASMSEEELAAEIDKAVDEAMADYATTTNTVTQSTSDGTVTTEEASSTTTDVYEVYNEIAYAEELIAAYYEYYGAYAEETLASLQAIEQDLNEIYSSLDEIYAIMEQGAEAATAAIDQLNAAVAEEQAKAVELQTKAQAWQQQVQTKIGERENKYANVQPNQVANDRIGALIQTHDFVEAFKGALGDGKFSPDELANIGQLAANAKASLNGTGEPQLQDFATKIDALTRNAARGEWNHARTGVSDFERSLPPRPRR